MAKNKPTYEDGVKQERARCVRICEDWMRPSYIDTHYGPIDEVGMRVLQKVVIGIEAEISSEADPE